ncbi:hypothetical protein AVEN_114121-1 [Araneus ventricosus]|uniref:Uncharacterized protein n=1 Tax=Araneus ventricosus TaxID=182803 RepID=A0A4Y2Q2G3_ARAVE|nr:hypothetical protein AVEN_114121-1 [Araneus ventricosus]
MDLMHVKSHPPTRCLRLTTRQQPVVSLKQMTPNCFWGLFWYPRLGLVLGGVRLLRCGTQPYSQPNRWLASTYQCDSEPRDYQECSQVHEPRVRGCRFLGVAYQSPNSVGTFNPLITRDLSSVLRSLTKFETPNPFLSAILPSNIQFLFTPEGVGEVVKFHLPFPTLDNGTLVDQQLTFLVVNPDYGKVLGFSPPPAYSGMTPKGTANVFADSDGIVAALCVKPFLCARLVSEVQMQLSCCLPPI